jgi:pyruvate dehydrogenase E2 component (dihydrolipoamide acetyltransferase)
VAEFYEMPSISPTMEIGTLIEWRVKEGESFQSSAVVAEVGTDKANMEAEIFDAGVMLKHLIAEGDEVPPGFPIAIWGAAGDDISGLLKEIESRKSQLGAAPAAEPAEAPEPEPEAAPPEPAKAPAALATPTAALSGKVDRAWQGTPIHGLFFDPPGDIRFGGVAAGRVTASPLARKVAADLGVDLSRVKGTGPGGRITRADVEDAPRGGVSAPAAAPSREDRAVRNSPMRKTIAKRLLQSHQDIPTFFLTATFDMQGFVDLRADMKARLPDVKVSYNDILILAVARALKDHPEVNASWGDKEIVRHGRVDIGVAVAIDDGLITPVVRNADQKGLSAIAGEVRELAGRARDQKLQPDEYTGGTFTISNLGMMGIEHFTAIINPPEAAILAVGSIDQVPIVVDGAFEIGWRMKVTMTCDHRVIDGAVGAAFLQTLRTYVESPWLLLV